jgi:hypothetical protein
MSESKTKPCTRCTIPKPLSDFPVQTETNDGRGTICKPCERQVRKEKKAKQAAYSKQFFTF